MAGLASRTLVPLSIALLLPVALCVPWPGGGEDPSAAVSVDTPRSGYLDVSELHSIYWETHGAVDGIPAICLHGGPGAMAGQWMLEYFDLERFHVLLFDQRGAGRSRPLGEWRENTTQLLVEDIGRLRDYLGIEGKAMLVGGSWGTTLALAYAEAHPDKVSGLLLRGVYLGTESERDFFYHGGAGRFFPEAYEHLQELVPDPDSLDYPRQLFEMTQDEDPEVREKAYYGWAFYEVRISAMGQTDEEVHKVLRRNKPMLKSLTVLENHYLMNDCFLEPGQLLRDVEKIAHLPTFIVNGRFDVICPPVSAWQLSKRLRTVELVLPDTGHSSGEEAIHEALVRGVEWVRTRVEEGD